MAAFKLKIGIGILAEKYQTVQAVV